MTSIKTNTGTRQPSIAPNFLSRPERVSGMPIFLLSLALACEIPRNLFQENPPLFMRCLSVAEFVIEWAPEHSAHRHLHGGQPGEI